jgi:hypothetical protein
VDTDTDTNSDTDTDTDTDVDSDTDRPDSDSEVPTRPIRIRYRTSPAQSPTEATTPTGAETTPIKTILSSKVSDIQSLRSKSTSLANELYKLGLFVGTGTDSNGQPIFELDRPLTRMEALALIIRLLGLEKTALAYTGVNTFTDVPEWGDRIAAYAYQAGITVGINDEHTLFAPDQIVTYQEFTAFLLRVINYYEKNSDFLYENALQKAVDIGLCSAAEQNSVKAAGQYLRADAIISLIDVLFTTMKQTNTTLIDDLAAKNVITAQSRDALESAVRAVYSAR